LLLKEDCHETAILHRGNGLVFALSALAEPWHACAFPEYRKKKRDHQGEEDTHVRLRSQTQAVWETPLYSHHWAKSTSTNITNLMFVYNIGMLPKIQVTIRPPVKRNIFFF
jgi:hypothetical protein